jgi:hypothetical protein
MLWSSYGCVQNLGAYKFKIILLVRKFHSLDLSCMEIRDECSNFVNNVYTHFVKIIWIFYDRRMGTKYISIAIFIIF